MDNKNICVIEGYTVQLVADRVWAIDEFGTDLIYLVEGTQKAAVIDTGVGFGNLKKVIETLTDHPYMVLNTHGHIDHAGGNGQFGEAYLHEKDFELANFERGFPGWEAFCDKTLREEGFYGQNYLDKNCPPKTFTPLPLSEHQVFELGERRLETIYTPGHTPGSVVFLDRENRLLFAGDSVVSTPILIFDTYSSTVQEFYEGLKALDREEFDLIFPGHYLRPVGKKVLHDLILCAEKILEGTLESEPVDFSHMSSEPAFLYQFGSGKIICNDQHIK